MDINPGEWWYLLAALTLVALSGLLSAAAVGILSVNRFRVQQWAENGAPAAKLLQRLQQHPALLLTATLMVITGLTFANGVLVIYWLHVRGGLPAWAVALTLGLVLLIFAEFAPIAYAAANPERVATHLVGLASGVTFLLRPFVAALTAVANGVVHLLGGEPRAHPPATGEEMLAYVDSETERGALEEEEKALIRSIFEFTDTVVREIMVPRIDISAVYDTQPVAEVIDIFVTEHYSRVPVYQGSLDHIVGVVYAKDLLPCLVHDDTARPVRTVMRTATFVPETKRVSELLRELRESKQTIAVVLDEYGGTAGLVTMEDLLEEIVGEIYDEYDVEQSLVEWRDDGSLLVDGKLPVDEVGALLHIELPAGEYETVGGLLYSRFGDIPARGDVVTINDLQFRVDQLVGRRITKVRIIPPPREKGDAEDGSV